jgi:hypothetical protein
VELARLLEHQGLVDELVEHLALAAHLLEHLLAHRLAVHLLHVLLVVLQGAVEVARADRVAVDFRRVRRSRALRIAAAPLREDEEDEDHHDGDEDPLELLETVAHDLEHRETASVSRVARLWMIFFG